MKVFIGSSSENKDVLDEISSLIEEFLCVPVPWNTPGLFLPGSFTSQRLTEIARNEVDAAILLYSPDDSVWYRGDNKSQPRDNVIFEHGLFAGILNFEKAIIIIAGGNTKSPSDLSGMTFIDYSNKSRAKIEIKKWISSIKSKKDVIAKPSQLNFDFNNDLILKQFSSFQGDMRDSILEFIAEIYWEYDLNDCELDGYLTFVLTKFIHRFIGLNDARFTIRQYDEGSDSMVTLKTTREDAIPGPIPLNKPNMISESAKRNVPIIYSENKEFHFATSNKSIEKGVYQDYVTYCLMETIENKPIFSICLDVKAPAVNKMKVLVHSLIFEIICTPIIEKLHIEVDKVEN